ncbi:MAG: cytochrome c [Caulobacteraceae bacterium]|jgi:mono/diheme cytochrome c family protein
MKNLLLAMALAAAPAAALADGKAVYEANCQACHQANGQGIKGAFPALAGDKIVDGPDAGPITQVLKGKGGMPGFAQLSDADVAAAVTYIRSTWGNHASPVTPAEVARIRQAH